MSLLSQAERLARDPDVVRALARLRARSQERPLSVAERLASDAEVRQALAQVEHIEPPTDPRKAELLAASWDELFHLLPTESRARLLQRRAAVEEVLAVPIRMGRRLAESRVGRKLGVSPHTVHLWVMRFNKTNRWNSLIDFHGANGKPK